MSPFSIGWAFSLAIFFLGMSAAFGGRFVERDIHKSSLISCFCFTIGMIGTGLIIQYCTGIIALLGIYLFYGVIMGIGLGIGYLTPVKTLMLWFKDNKGLATGISIMGFGLAKAIATPIMNILQDKFGVASMFIILGGCYFIIMMIGHFLLKKPDGWVESITKTQNILCMFKKKEFIGIWLMFFINIHVGLMIISYEKQILNVAFATTAILTTIINIVPAFSAGFNALGRIGYSAWSDKMKQRNSIYKTIFFSCAAAAAITYITNAIKLAHSSWFFGAIVIIFLFIINAGYGGGFSTLPALLSERYGMEKISAIHGCALSAWGMAGLTGNNTSAIILNYTNDYNKIIVLGVLLYVIAYFICINIVKNKT